MVKTLKKLFSLTILMLSILSTADLHAFDILTEFDLQYDINDVQRFNQKASVDVTHDSDYIDFFWNFSVCNDLKYQPSHGEDWYFGFYFFMENGGVSIDFKDIDVTFGRTALDDSVNSPYSLFISSKLFPALTADFSYDDGTFFFTSRWTQLNRDSNLYLDYEDNSLDRGWQYNTYGIYAGDWRIGFQDSSVYTDTSFNPEFFFNPLPGFLKQHTISTPGKPWDSGGNANSIVGFFVDLTASDYYLYGQFLLDDFTNILGLFDEDAYHNPNKIAWSFGGDYKAGFGTLGFYHAGATKYTFQAYGKNSLDTKYGYTFYPDVSYTANGVLMPIELSDNYLGYYNGENNLAFLADYEGSLYSINLYSSLEFMVSGAKSPANPWHELTWFDSEEPFFLFMLDSERLEKKLTFTAGTSRALPELSLPNLTVSAALEAGYIWNVLKLIDVPADLQSEVNEIQYWSPAVDDQAIFSLTIGGRYTF